VIIFLTAVSAAAALARRGLGSYDPVRPILIAGAATRPGSPWFAVDTDRRRAQIRAVPSWLAVTTRAPSGLNVA
jgi:hypothetical protein